MTEVFINGQRLDLNTRDVIALTKQINDVAEIQRRQADFTNRFTIPKTPNNIRIAEMLNVPGNNSSRPYAWSTAVIISDGIPITTQGIALITETKSQSAYELIIYAGNYDLPSKTEDKLITDIDWSDLDHVFDKDSWTASLNNTEGYIYAIADTLGNRLTVDPTSVLRIDLNFQVPHVYVKTIWDRIFSEAGLTYGGDFFTDNDTFNNQIIAAHRNYYDDVTYKHVNHITWNALGFSVGVAYDMDSFTILKTGIYNVKLDIDIELADRGNVHFIVKKNGITISDQVIISPLCTATMERFKLSPEFEDVFYIGDVVDVEILFDSTGCGFPDLPNGYLFTSDTTIIIVSAYFLNDTIEFSKYLPAIKQIDFLKAIMQQYGLLYKVNPDGSYTFAKIEDVLNSVFGIDDYSSKLSGESSETYNQNYNNVNRFEYDYDDDDLILGNYADASFNIASDNIRPDGPVVSSIIKAAGDYYLYDNWQKIAQIFTYKNAETNILNPPNYKLEDNDVMVTTVVNRGRFVSAIQLYDSYKDVVLANVLFFSSNAPVAQFTTLHWQTLMDLYYPKFILMVQKPVQKKVQAWLTPVDIYFLDMFKLIYLEQYQSYFYLNKVNNFQPGKLSECELIKIN